MKGRKRRWLLLWLCGAVLLIVLTGWNTRLTVTEYLVESETVDAPVRLAVLADLHSCNYGANQRELLEAVAAQQPDLVLLCGDIVDDGPEMPEERALFTVEALAEQWPTYYVSGNHEYRTGRADELKQLLRGRGAVVLAGDCVQVTAAGQRIQLCGVDDPAVGERAWQRQLEQVSEELEQGVYAILLSHRPERAEAYQPLGFDLVLSGHAHGGQWRLPGLGVGLIAPNQGLLPRYTGGVYDLGETKLVVSRGLARESTRLPRLYNPPEVVMVEVRPVEGSTQKNN